MTVNFIAVTFDEGSKTYQALSTLKGLDREGRIELKSAAVVERDATGQLQIPEDTDNAIGEGFAAGGLIGMLVGVLGGPLGMFLGLGTGGLIGGLYDMDQADMQDQTLAEVGRHVPPGRNALLAEVEEYADGVVDGAMRAQGGTVLRRSADDVLARSRRPRKLLRRHRGRPARRRASPRRRKCTKSTRIARRIFARSCTLADKSANFVLEGRSKSAGSAISALHYRPAGYVRTSVSRRRPLEPRVRAGIDAGHFSTPRNRFATHPGALRPAPRRSDLASGHLWGRPARPAGIWLASFAITLSGYSASTLNQTCRGRSRRGVGLGQLVEVRQRSTADLRGLVGRQAEHDQHVAGGAISRLGVAAFGLIMQQLAQPQQRTACHRQRERRIVHGEPAGAPTDTDVTQSPRSQAAVSRDQRQPGVEKHPAHLRAPPEQPSDQPETSGECLRRILAFGGQLVEYRAEVVEHLVDRRLEQLFLTVEVVVERTHPDVRGLGDLEHRHVEFAGRDKSPSGADECRASAHLAPFQAVSGSWVGLGHEPMLAGNINLEHFVRNS